MLLNNRPFTKQIRVSLCLFLIGLSLPLMALESDRQEPLEVSANSTDGTLGDGITTLRGNVDIRQGTLRITADEAEVNKVDGKVSAVTFRGKPAFLEQEIEEQGLVQATANTIDYQVASGIVTLSGNADVKHPQYQISGELLTYDLNIQHFQGSSDKDGNGRIHILLDPEVISSEGDKKDKKDGAGVKQPDTDLNSPASDTKDSGKDGN
jgi:lipopolysaccharide export system protein LptA